MGQPSESPLPGTLDKSKGPSGISESVSRSAVFDPNSQSPVPAPEQSLGLEIMVGRGAICRNQPPLDPVRQFQGPALSVGEAYFWALDLQAVGGRLTAWFATETHAVTSAHGVWDTNTRKLKVGKHQSDGYGRLCCNPQDTTLSTCPKTKLWAIMDIRVSPAYMQYGADTSDGAVLLLKKLRDTETRTPIPYNQGPIRCPAAPVTVYGYPGSSSTNEGCNRDFHSSLHFTKPLRQAVCQGGLINYVASLCGGTSGGPRIASDGTVLGIVYGGNNKCDAQQTSTACFTALSNSVGNSEGINVNMLIRSFAG
eukprot:jgi/Botrbrau1/2642/Bobra.145_1s0058.2